MIMRILKAALMVGFATVIAVAPANAQDGTRDDRRAVSVQPYIEVSQILSAELSPGDDVVTYTQVAAGVDLNAQGRNSGASVSLRYERNIGYGDDVDSDTISGVARGYVAVIPRSLNFEAGALAARTRVDGGGGVSTNPLVAEDAESQIYSVYAGPSLATRVGAVDVTGIARVGYNRFETDDVIVDSNGDPVDVFDDSVTYTGQVRAGTRAGDALPVGIGVTAGAFQEDVSNLDQRIRDLYVRGDVTVPVSDNFAVVGGIGYEDVEISSRDALRNPDGTPVIGDDGRFVTDSSAPRRIAFDVDGLIWDVGVIWNPSSRTSLAATVGRRYDSTTYYGSFAYAPSSRSALNISVYDGLTGFGGVLNNSLAGLSSDFEALRNPVTGDFSGLVTGEDGSGLVGTLGSVRSAAFRGRGVRASYQHRIGRATAAIGAGYDEREFIAAAGTVLAAADGITDESYYLTGTLSRPIGRSASFATNAYVNWFKSGGDNGDVTAIGGSAAYNRSITDRLSARAALAVDYFDSEFTAEDFAFATALLGLRYDF
ncbi:preprotein translocase subunit YajC [Erythrobacter sp. JK5]|uniref:preprotein translocase subunit YajC n=1 Tax=Erythrobacter sp. JK5 TaxID=2829500 RepID=UPI001BA548F6|nr:preprotein translocase subunit YajC [Erythrobacter sp. JK5]QUL38597.1 preprotein translocase subunit YajC [Erythrobacter sp. JK5]